ncbi:MAG: sulfatase-like hydrolase/transferase, partial [Pseudomonadota bacterium]
MKNAILISIDDLFNHVRYRDKFGVEVHTPNIDRLAAMGTFFEQAYATTPVCSPSRATIVTGQSMFETGIFGNAEDFYKFIDVQDTIFAAYKTAGYTTVANGKIFHSTALEPGYASGIIDRTTNPTGLNNETFGIPFGSGPAPAGTPDSAFWDYDVVSNAIEFLNSNAAAAPYFLTVGLVRPHYPTIAPQSYFDLYPLEDIIDAGISPEGLALPDFARQFLKDNDPPSATATRIQAYLASVSFADAQLGRLFEAMDEGGHWDDTTVLLFSDHGFQLGDRDFFGKFTLWEEAANAPLIVYDPDQATAGRTVETPISLNQIFPTMTELSGIATPSSVTAQSFAALVDPSLGSHQAKPALTFINGSVGMRDGDLRLIRYEDGSLELYDVAADPQQAVNLAADPANRSLLIEALRSLRDAARDEQIRLVGETEELVFGAGGEAIIATGAGRLIGGLGDDAYFIEAGAIPVETRNGGEDMVVFRASEARDVWQYWLPAHIENLTVGIGVNEMTVMGNNLGNRIVANNSRDASLTVNAGFGDDSVFGSLGEDTLIGAGGDDI